MATVSSTTLIDRLDHRLELLYLLVAKDLKIRYKSSVLGYMWALANPLAFAFVYWLAFKFIMRVQMENYSLYLITGIFPWVWLSTGVTQATRSFQVNASLVKKVKLRRAILPLSSVVQEMIHFLFALPIIIGFVVASGGFTIQPAWLWQIPLLICLQLMFIYPLALILAVANVFVHDVDYLVALGFSLLFFLTPMVYPITMIPAEVQPYFELNPLHQLIDAWRRLFFAGKPFTVQLVYVIVAAAVLWVVAWLLYRRLGPRIGELL